MNASPVPIYAWPVHDHDCAMRRVVVTAPAAAQVAALPVPDLFPGGTDLAPSEVVRFDGASVVVLDLATRSRVALRRCACTLVGCGCALEWFAPGSTPPEPDVYWPGWLEDE